MKEAKYTVLTKNAYLYKWSFTEQKRENDYGNGIYIAIKSPSGELSGLDCRYATNYDFNKMCVDYLLKYYGKNLDELTEDDNELNEHDFLIELERLKAEYAHQRGWDIDENGEDNQYWYEDDEKLYAAECYAYEILEKGE